MTLDTFFDNFEQLAAAPNGVAKLRELILELAFKGKLLNDSANHEPASVNPIARASTARDGMNAGPASAWISCRLVDVAQVLMGNSPPGSSYNQRGEGMPLINGPVEFSYGHFGKTLRTKFTTSPTKCCEENDLLLCVRGSTTGRTNISGFRACIGRGVAAIRAKIYQDYINLFIHFKRQHIYELGTGSTFPSISQKDIESLVIPFPPVAEQKRIVAKVDELMRICDELEEQNQRRRETRSHFNNVTLAPFRNTVFVSVEKFEQASLRLADNFDVLYDSSDTVGKLRSTILQLAVRGKLVPQDLCDEDASALLERNRSSKLQLLIELHLQQSEPSQIDKSSPPYDVPTGWGWARLSDLGVFLGGGTPSKSNPSFWQGSIPWVSPKDMKSLYIVDTRDHISKQAVEDSTVRIIRAHSLLMVVRGMILAHSFPVALTLTDVTINQDIKALIIASPDISEYLLVACRGLRDVMLNNVVRSSHGTCRLDSKDVENFLIPIPPLAEQKRIVAKVNQLMSLCEELETKLREAEAHSEKLVKAAVQYVLEAINEAHNYNGAVSVPTH